MPSITLYYKSSDITSTEIIPLLENLKGELGFEIILINISSDPILEQRYSNASPVLRIGPYLLKHTFTEKEIRVAFGAAQDRANQIEKINSEDNDKKNNTTKRISHLDRIAFWISKNYMAVINLVLAFYVGIPFIAPILMHVGVDAPARMIYLIYRPLCHQLAFRSWFLFGEQAFYPREEANIFGVTSYEEMMGIQAVNLNNIEQRVVARDFIGNEVVGYKVALCQRDVAIYGSMLFFGIIFSITKKRIKPVPWTLWLLVGVIPVGVDGLSQMTELIVGTFTWLPLRESTPFLRTLTGGLFGFLTGWYLFPLIAESMADTLETEIRKNAILGR